MKIILMTLSLFVLLTCKTAKDETKSRLTYSPMELSTKEQIYNRYADTPGVYDSFRRRLAFTDRMVMEANEIIEVSFRDAGRKDSKISSSYFSQCLSEGGSEVNCAKKSTIPLEAAKKLNAAKKVLLNLQGYFDIPVLKEDLSKNEKLVFSNVYGSEDAVPNKSTMVKFQDLVDADSPLELILPDGSKVTVQDKVDWWETSLDGKCSGSMVPDLRAICEEFYLSISLIELSMSFFEQFSEDQGNLTLLEEFYRHYEMAQERLHALQTLYGDITRRLSGIEEGILTPQSVMNVPFIAVLGSPDKFLSKVTEYSNQIKDDLRRFNASHEKVKEYEKAVIQDGKEALNIINRIETELATDESYQVDDSIFSSEFDFLTQKVEKITEHREKMLNKFKVSFDNIFGKASGENARIGEPEFATVRPNGTMALVPSKPNMNAVSIRVVGSPKIIANGIYADDRLKPTEAFGWGCCKNPIKSVTKKAKKAISKVGKDLGNKFEGAKKRASSTLEKAKKLKLSDALAIANPGNLLGGGLGILGLTDLSGLGGDPNDSLSKIGGFLKPVADMGRSLVRNMVPAGNMSPLALLDDVKGDLKEVDYPRFDVHVYNQTTGLDGYIVSKSFNQGYNIGKGKSSGESVGINAGVSFIVSAGASFGANVGESSNAGASKGSGVSMQVGFYANTALPSARVGALIAELDCAGRKTYQAVGVANVLILPTNWNDSCRISLLINDNLAGAKQASCYESDDKTTKVACGRGDDVRIELQYYVDRKKVFQKLLTIFNSPEFTDATKNAAWSNDPFGAGRRIFRNMANAQGLTDIDSFLPVVDNFISVAVDEKELARLAIELSKLESERKKINIQKVRLDNSIQNAKQILASSNSVADINRHLLQVSNTIYKVDRETALHRVKRLKMWASIYKVSRQYHSFSAEIDQDMQILDQTVELLNKNIVDGSVAAFEAFSFIERLNQDYQDQAFLKKIVSATRVGHCFISLNDLGLSSVDFTKPETLPKSMQYIPREIQLTDGNPVGNPEFDLDIAKRISLSQGSIGNGYFKVTLRTDPQKITSSYLDPFTENGDSVAPTLRCDEKQRGRSKIIGAAVSYNAGRGDNSALANAYIDHGDMMFSYHDDRYFYAYLDRSWEPRLFKSNFSLDSLPKPLKMLSSTTLQSSAAGCLLEGGFQSWQSEQCMLFVLGKEYNPDTLQPEGVAKSFFNSYLGGTWDFYFPDDPRTVAFLDSVRNMNIHFWVKYEEDRL